MLDQISSNPSDAMATIGRENIKKNQSKDFLACDMMVLLGEHLNSIGASAVHVSSSTNHKFVY